MTIHTTIRRTTFSFDGESLPEVKTVFRHFRPETLKRKAVEFLGDRVGAVTVFVDGHGEFEVIRHEKHETPFTEELES